MTPRPLYLGLLPALLLCSALAGTPVANAQNFTCCDRQIVQAAEEARFTSARFWTGRSLPGDWSRPCPIRVLWGASGGSGCTRFRFERGEVFGWEMEVRGTRGAIMNDVIPHEVDHAVRASLVRHPIERWLDEGCAALFESPEAHSRLRTVALRVSDETIHSTWLASGEYPSHPEAISVLYASGFSLVEFLLSRSDASTLLNFQKGRRPIDQRLREHYRLTIGDLRTEWSTWRRDTYGGGSSCADCGCPLHSPGRTRPVPNDPSSGLPSLVVWTADWCPPCQKFWSDLETDSEFRERLLSRFAIIRRDIDAYPGEAQRNGVSQLPTFDAPAGRVVGYLGKDDLLRKLGFSPPPPVADAPARPKKPEPVAPLGSMTSPAVSAPATKPAHSRSPEESQPPRADLISRMASVWSVAMPLLQWTSVVGGTLAGGGVGGAAFALAMFLLRRRRARRGSSTRPTLERSRAEATAPFPRRLDEARQLLELRQSEGRVAALDALRGMFLDDELDKLAQTEDPLAQQVVGRLRSAIDDRLAEVAPVSTSASPLAPDS